MQTQIPKEIKDYREKILFGLSIRQLAFSGLSGAVGIGSFFVLDRLLHVPLTITSYLIVLLCAPFMALGFIRIHGYPFEQYVKLMRRHKKRGRKPRLPTSHSDFDRMYEVEHLRYAKPTTSQKRRRSYALQEESKTAEELKKEIG